MKMPLATRVGCRMLRSIGTLCERMPQFRFIRETRDSQVPITFPIWFFQRVLGINGSVYWPMHPTSIVSYSKRVRIGIETSPGLSPGCYIHGFNGIEIGDYTQIAPNVGIMSGNHDVYDLSKQLEAPPIRIGRYCWLGMNVVVLPGIILGDYTIVGANSVLTKSFNEGYCVVAGNPAKKIKDIEPGLVADYTSRTPYVGYLPAANFEAFAAQNLDLKALTTCVE